jgi:formylglycine-generating enzyme required for sulfatase activity
MDKTFKWAMIIFFLLLTAIPMVAVRIGEKNRKRLETQERFAAQNAPGSPIANEWVLVPAGDFIMGSNDGDYDEKPERSVHLGAYFIQKYEVTVHQYMEFVSAKSHRSPLTVRDNATRPHFDNPNKPIVYVSWDDAAEYCGWIGGRLPTEAEWEKAARGINGRVWPWGNKKEATYGNLRGDEDNYRFTASVGSFEHDVSPFGVYDMAGNAREWVADWYGEVYYRSGPIDNPKGPVEGETRSLRGGSWNDTLVLARTSARIKMFPDYRDVSIGFRCVREATEGPASREG